MVQYTRRNAWNNGGTFNNSDLLWYARGVGEMMKLGLDSEHSWWFFGAIHGEVVTPPALKVLPAIPWKQIPAPPSVPVTPLPKDPVWKKFWDQCQHQSWFFTPWHRGYLLALEAHIRDAVKKLGGPASWALPYWNYFGGGNQAKIPPAFMELNLPPAAGGGANPLYVKARYGPKGNGNVFVPIPPTSERSLNDHVYTGGSNAIPPGFGGPLTKFHHGQGDNGGLENFPHNQVHGYVGGPKQDALMSFPALAALDPIFYVHHANIDRLWAIWNGNPANTNPTDPKWLKGPASVGDREFVMPMPDGTEWVYTPQEMNSRAQLDYSYEELAAAPDAADLRAQRLTRLGVSAATIRAREGAAVSDHVELVGASEPGLAIKASGATTAVKLDDRVRRKVSASLATAAETTAPDRVFLKLENVRGDHDATVLSVYVNLPEGAKPEDHPELLAGSVGLFGLRSASHSESPHGGQGLSYTLEITEIVDALHLKNALNTDSVRVTLVPYGELPDTAKITVGRVSIYRLGA